MNGLVAGLGSILQVKPILRMYDGNPTSERLRTRHNAIQRLTRILEETVPLQQAAIIHADAEERARDLIEQTRHLLPEGDVPLVEVSPVIGAHVGPV
jgi:fatty acid-binding protein DegV